MWSVACVLRFCALLSLMPVPFLQEQGTGDWETMLVALLRNRSIRAWKRNCSRDRATGNFFELIGKLAQDQLTHSTSACRVLPGAAGLGKTMLFQMVAAVAAQMHPGVVVVYASCNHKSVRDLLPSELFYWALDKRKLDLQNVDARSLTSVQMFMTAHGLYGVLMLDEMEDLYKADREDYFDQLVAIVSATPRRVVGIFTGSAAVLPRLLRATGLEDEIKGTYPAKTSSMNGTKTTTVHIEPFIDLNDFSSLVQDAMEERGGTRAELSREVLRDLFWWSGGNARLLFWGSAQSVFSFSYDDSEVEVAFSLLAAANNIGESM
jgi:hypothetical protein